MERLLPSFISSIRMSLRAASDVVGALDRAAQNYEPGSVLGAELARYAADRSSGVPVEQAITAFGMDYDVRDLDILRAAIISGTKQGGSIDATLERVSRVIDQRRVFRQNANAEIGRERMIVKFFTTVWFGALVYQLIFNRAQVVTIWESPLGKLGSIVAVATFVTAYLYFSSLVNKEY